MRTYSKGCGRSQNDSTECVMGIREIWKNLFEGYYSEKQFSTSSQTMNKKSPPPFRKYIDF